MLDASLGLDIEELLQSIENAAKNVSAPGSWAFNGNHNNGIWSYREQDYVFRARCRADAHYLALLSPENTLFVVQYIRYLKAQVIKAKQEQVASATTGHTKH